MVALAPVFAAVVLFSVALGTLAAVFGMRAVSLARGGIDFGDVEPAVFKIALLFLTSASAYLLTPAGGCLSLIVWVLGFPLFFRAEWPATVPLAVLNRGLTWCVYRLIHFFCDRV